MSVRLQRIARSRRESNAKIAMEICAAVAAHRDKVFF